MSRKSLVLVMVFGWGAAAASTEAAMSQWPGFGWLANPALLSSPDIGAWEIWLAQGDIAVRNNAFNLDMYRTYNGTFLDADDKERILDSISGKSARGLLRGEGGAVGVHVGRAAFLTKAYVGGDLTVDKDLIDLMFFGNDIDRRYELLSSGGMLAYVSMGGAFGFPTGQVAGWETSTGIGARIAIGGLAAKIEESSIEILTQVEGLTATGATVIRRTKDSDGAGRPATVAFDLGGRAAKGPWEVAIALKDVGPSFSWSDVEEKVIEFEALEWTAEMGDSGYTTVDTTYDVGSWSTPLPTRLECTAARSLSWGAAYARWEQGLRRWAGVTTTPRVHAGVAWDALSWLCPWLELGIGSPEGFGLSVGAALRPGPVRLDLGVTGFRLPPSHSEALGVQLGLGFGG